MRQQLGAAPSRTTDAARLVDAQIMAVFTYPGPIALWVGQARWYNDLGRAVTIQSVRASLGTSPGTQAVLVDVDKNGTTIFTNQAHRPSIGVGANTAQVTTIDVPSVAVGDYLTMDIEQIGTGPSGSDLVVNVVML